MVPKLKKGAFYQRWSLEAPMTAYSFEGMTPVIHPTAYVHPAACIIGDVIIGCNAYIGPFASLRGDMGRLILKDDASVQDNCVIHGITERDTVIGEQGYMGPRAVVHGSEVGRNAMIGIGSIVLDFCQIGAEAIIDAQSLIKSGEIVPPRTFWSGVPAKRIRDVTDDDLAWKNIITQHTLSMPALYRETLKPVEPLRAVEPNRGRTTPGGQLRKS